MYLEKKKLSEVMNMGDFYFEDKDNNLLNLIKIENLGGDIFLCAQSEDLDEKYEINGTAKVYKEIYNPCKKKYDRHREEQKQERIDNLIRTLDILEEGTDYFDEVFKTLKTYLNEVNIEDYHNKKTVRELLDEKFNQIDIKK